MDITSAGVMDITTSGNNSNINIESHGSGTVDIVDSITKITDTTQSTTNTDGSLIVSGGVGIAKNMYIAGSINKYTHLSAAHGSTITITVTVVTKTATHRYFGTGSSQGYALDNIESPFLTLTPGRTYRFSGSVAGSHPFRFYYDVGKTTQYTTGVTIGSGYVDLEVTDTTPTVLHYQCSAHDYMGNAVYVNTNVLNSPHESIVRNNIRLQKDNTVLSFGANDDVSLTHTNSGLTLSSQGILSIDTVGTAAINLGTQAVAKTITIGNDASAKVDVNALAIELDSAGTIVTNSVTSTSFSSGTTMTRFRWYFSNGYCRN